MNPVLLSFKFKSRKHVMVLTPFEIYLEHLQLRCQLYHFFGLQSLIVAILALLVIAGKVFVPSINTFWTSVAATEQPT